MEPKIRQYVDHCQVCKKSKSQQKYALLPDPFVQYNPWEIIQFDLFGIWSFTDINNVPHQIQGLCIIEIATRWVKVYLYRSKRAVKNPQTTSFVECIQQVIVDSIRKVELHIIIVDDILLPPFYKLLPMD
jgi:hypothetical protein